MAEPTDSRHPHLQPPAPARRPGRASRRGGVHRRRSAARRGGGRLAARAPSSSPPTRGSSRPGPRVARPPGRRRLRLGEPGRPGRGRGGRRPGRAPPGGQGRHRPRAGPGGRGRAAAPTRSWWSAGRRPPRPPAGRPAGPGQRRLRRRRRVGPWSARPGCYVVRDRRRRSTGAPATWSPCWPCGGPADGRHHRRPALPAGATRPSTPARPAASATSWPPTRRLGGRSPAACCWPSCPAPNPAADHHRLTPTRKQSLVIRTPTRHRPVDPSPSPWPWLPPRPWWRWSRAACGSQLVDRRPGHHQRRRARSAGTVRLLTDDSFAVSQAGAGRLRGPHRDQGRGRQGRRRRSRWSTRRS